jgi:hypothetical protein
MAKQRQKARSIDLADPVADRHVCFDFRLSFLGRALIALRYERFAGRVPKLGELQDWVQSLVDRELLEVRGAVRSDFERRLVHGDDSREVVDQVLAQRRRAGGAA